jgi:hypothetical protein
MESGEASRRCGGRAGKEACRGPHVFSRCNDYRYIFTLAHLSKIGGCVLTITYNLVQRQRERGYGGNRHTPQKLTGSAISPVLVPSLYGCATPAPEPLPIPPPLLALRRVQALHHSLQPRLDHLHSPSSRTGRWVNSTPISTSLPPTDPTIMKHPCWHNSSLPGWRESWRDMDDW